MINAIEDFLQHLKLEQGLAENTISAYRADLMELVRQFPKSTPVKITASDLNKYFADLAARGRRPATLARKVSAVRCLFGYLQERGVVRSSPASGYRAPKLARYHPDYLSVGEIEQILEACKTDPRLAVRDKAIIEVLYGCGLRISELAGLRVGDVEFEAGFLKVIGKGNKQRLVPLGEYARRAIEEYLDDPLRKKHLASGSQPVFVNRSGSTLSRVGLWKIIRKLVLRAGIAKSVTPHTFRHSFATHLLAGGADLRTVQEMLGHADISTTEIYTQIDQGYIVAEHRRHHPRELAGFRRK
ncbi:MAG: tyrosine recombinase XerD [candidate division Zixibacteria bacterium]|nr:tyrosine recombinase XerD [candidate division Zixibacteria bacterium]